MSPEQAMGRADVDARTDVFALGAILYEMVTGRVAFEGSSIAKILLRIMHEEPTPPSGFGAPAALDAVIARALRKDKLERFAGARELAEAAISALAIQGTVEELARASQTEIATRLAQRAPRIDPESAAVTVRPPSSPELASEQPHAAGQSARSTAVSSVLPPIPKRGLDGAQLLWVAVAVLVACGVLALILT
jgi:serine/threonine-protein kinase